MYDMLHHYNYSNTLNRFLSGYHHQLDDPNGNDHENPLSGLCDDSTAEEEPRCTSNSSATSKSFTIAAILGLNNNENSNLCSSSTDLNVVNLSVHQGNPDRPFVSNRLQLSVNQHNFVPSSHYPVSGHGIPSSKASIRSGKHISSNILQNKKTCKGKRVRTIFTPEQLERLEAEFEKQQYMVGPERLYLAHTLQLTEAQVKVWFQNRRIKWRKHHLELTHQRLAVLKQQQQLLLDEAQPDVQDTNSSEADT